MSEMSKWKLRENTGLSRLQFDGMVCQLCSFSMPQAHSNLSFLPTCPHPTSNREYASFLGSRKASVKPPIFNHLSSAIINHQMWHCLRWTLLSLIDSLLRAGRTQEKTHKHPSLPATPGNPKVRHNAMSSKHILNACLFYPVYPMGRVEILTFRNSLLLCAYLTKEKYFQIFHIVETEWCYNQYAQQSKGPYLELTCGQTGGKEIDPWRHCHSSSSLCLPLTSFMALVKTVSSPAKGGHCRFHRTLKRTKGTTEICVQRSSGSLSLESSSTKEKKIVMLIIVMWQRFWLWSLSTRWCHTRHWAPPKLCFFFYKTRIVTFSSLWSW